MRRLVAIVLVTAAGAATAVVLLTASSASARDRIVAAALAQKSVHYTRTVGEDMGGTFRSTADVNADSGIEWKKFYVGAVEIRLVNDTLYVHGDVQGLVNALQLTLPQAERSAGHWISITSSSGEGLYDEQLYGRLADGLTLASIIHDAAPGGTLKSFTKTSNGTQFLVVRGASLDMSANSADAELVATASGKPLPVAFSSAQGPANWTEVRFSKWNEPVNVQAPANAVPIATVRG